MTDAESLRRAVEGCTTVVHLVAILLGRPEEFEAVMIQGTRDLVEASKQAGVTRLVLQSALGTEEGREVAPYFHAKWEEEQAVKYSGLEHVIFRPSFVFGRDGGILAEQIKIVRYSPVTPILGRHRMQPIWVDDVASLFTAAVSADGGAQQDVRCRRARPPQLGGAPRADPQDPREAPARLPDAPGPAQGRGDDRPGPASVPRRTLGGGDARPRRQRRRHRAGDRGLRNPTRSASTSRFAGQSPKRRNAPKLRA